MLQSIREHTQGWIAGAIISVIILTFALWGVHSYFLEGAGHNTTIVEVNGTEISKEQLTVAYERLRRQVQAEYGATGLLSMDHAALKARALESLIDVEVLRQAAGHQGFHVFNQQMNEYLQNMPEFQVNGQFSVERFQDVMSSALMSTTEFLDLIKTSLLIDQPKLGILFSSFALPTEATRAIELVGQERDIAYINLPIERFLAGMDNVVSPQQVQSYYEKYQKDFMAPEQVSIEYVELSLTDVINKKARPSETTLKNFYQENLSSFVGPMEWKLVDVLVPVPDNASEEEKARAKEKINSLYHQIEQGQLAEVPRSYRGPLFHKGWTALNQVPVEFQKQVLELKKPGQIVGPFLTSKGPAFIMAVDVKLPKVKPYDEVDDQVSDMYMRQQAEEEYASKREKLADIAYEHPNSLEAVSKAMGLSIKASGFFTKDQGTNDIAQNKKVREAAFMHDVLDLKNNSEVIQLSPEKAIVLRVKSHVPAALIPIGSVAKQIEGKLKLAEAEARAAEFAQALRTKLQSGAAPQQLAKQNHLVWTNTGLISRYATKVDPAILDLAFSLPRPVEKDHYSYGTARLPSGHAVVALRSVKEGASNNHKQYNIFAEQVQNSQGLLEYELYKKSQIKEAKIKKAA